MKTIEKQPMTIIRGIEDDDYQTPDEDDYSGPIRRVPDPLAPGGVCQPVFHYINEPLDFSTKSSLFGWSSWFNTST
jgi:hypothetical protein